jgi:hypothetical protein
VALQAQYIFDRFRKFPGTVSSMIATIYLQAYHLDLEFYDEFYKPVAYLRNSTGPPPNRCASGLSHRFRRVF